MLDSISSQRRAELPEAQMIDHARLDGIGGCDEKPVHQGIAAAVWPLNAPHIDAFLAAINYQFSRGDTRPVRLLLLDQLSDPRNFGAIMRSAQAFGVSGIITTYRHAADENGVLARTASGALEHVPLIRVVNLARTIKKLQSCGFIVAGLARDGSAEISTLAAHKHLAIILGSEGNGLRRLSREHCDMLVRINISSETESLNVSNAAAIALYATNLQPTD